jgi:hypothetical protein
MVRESKFAAPEPTKSTEIKKSTFKKDVTGNGAGNIEW